MNTRDVIEQLIEAVGLANYAQGRMNEELDKAHGDLAVAQEKSARAEEVINAARKHLAWCVNGTGRAHSPTGVALEDALKAYDAAQKA